MIAFARSIVSRPRIPDAARVIQLSRPKETLIIPWHQDRIDAELGPDDEITKLIIYVKRRPKRRRLLDRFWR